ncbi:MAG: hypothetical protein HYX63_11690 [Gammaproteobacteria bacterium]|nr:hypothetical protein [Gammaproteobacteria bacterium]
MSNRQFPAFSRFILALSLAAPAGHAFAANDAMLQLLTVLRNKGTIDDETFHALNVAAQADEEHNVALIQTEKQPATVKANGTPRIAEQPKSAAAVAPISDPSEVKVTLNEGLKFKTMDGNFSAQIGAFFQADTAAYWTDSRSNFSNGTELRRGRLSLAGTVLDAWDYKFEADFAGTTQGGSTNTVKVTDALVRYRGLGPVSITAGNFKPPYSLEALMSDTNTTFIERSVPFQMINDRLLGGMAMANGANWTAAAGVFGAPVAAQNSANEGLTGSARFTYDPVLAADQLVHFGASMQIRQPDTNANGPDTLRFSAKPETNIISDALTACATVTAVTTGDCARGKFGNQTGLGRSSGRLVDTGNISGGVNYALLGNLEMAALYGPFSMQGEFVRTAIDRDTGGSLDFDSYYVYGSVFLTPDSRVYKGDRGIFDAVQPRNPFKLGAAGWGAVELGLRFSSLDLNDRDIHGGKLQDLTAGLNWYLNRFVRLSANYINVLGLDGGAHNGEDLNAVQFRAQFVY